MASSKFDKQREKRWNNPPSTAGKSKARRTEENAAIRELRDLLPVPEQVKKKLKKAHVIRLVASFFKIKRALHQSVHIQQPSPSDPFDANGNLRDDPLALLNGNEMLNWMNGFVMLLDMNGKILFVTEQVVKHLSFYATDLITDHILEWLSPEYYRDFISMFYGMEPTSNTLQDILDQVSTREFATDVDGKLVIENEFNVHMKIYLKKHQRRSGHDRYSPVNWRVREHREKNGHRAGVIIFATPLDQKSILDIGITDGQMFICKFNCDLKVTLVDPRLQTILGYEEKEILGKNLYVNLEHPDDHESKAQCTQNLMIGGMSVSNYYRLKNKAGFYVWIQSQAFAVYNNQRTVVAYVSYNYVISRQAGNRYLRSGKVSTNIMQDKAIQPECRPRAPAIVELNSENFMLTSEDKQLMQQLNIPYVEEAIDTGNLMTPNNASVAMSLSSSIQIDNAVTEVPASYDVGISSSTAFYDVVPNAATQHNSTALEVAGNSGVYTAQQSHSDTSPMPIGLLSSRSATPDDPRATTPAYSRSDVDAVSSPAPSHLSTGDYSNIASVGSLTSGYHTGMESDGQAYHYGSSPDDDAFIDTVLDLQEEHMSSLVQSPESVNSFSSVTSTSLSPEAESILFPQPVASEVHEECSLENVDVQDLLQNIEDVNVPLSQNCQYATQNDFSVTNIERQPSALPTQQQHVTYVQSKMHVTPNQAVAVESQQVLHVSGGEFVLDNGGVSVPDTFGQASVTVHMPSLQHGPLNAGSFSQIPFYSGASSETGSHSLSMHKSNDRNPPIIPTTVDFCANRA